MCCVHCTLHIDEYYYVDSKGDHVAVGAVMHKSVLLSSFHPPRFLNEGYKNDDDDFALNNTTEKQWEWINNTKYFVCTYSKRYTCVLYIMSTWFLCNKNIKYDKGINISTTFLIIKVSSAQKEEKINR